MLKDKKGLSAIVLTIIMVGLVLIAVSIVWAVILNVLERQSESLDVSQKCVGIVIKPTGVTCDGAECQVVLERGMGSTGDPVDGVGITLSTATESDTEVIQSGNVPATKTITLNTTLMATNADVRIYFTQEEENKFCSQLSSYP